MTIPTRKDLAAARRTLQEDREGFIALAPQIGLTRRIARKHFAAPRKLAVCVWLFDEFARNVDNGDAECLDVICWRMPEPLAQLDREPQSVLQEAAPV